MYKYTTISTISTNNRIKKKKDLVLLFFFFHEEIISSEKFLPTFSDCVSLADNNPVGLSFNKAILFGIALSDDARL